MKYLKILILAIVAVFTVGAAEAQIQVRANIGDGHYYHHHHYYHHRYFRHHRWMYRD